MKKLLVVLLALMMACFSVNALAVTYGELEIKAEVEFEGITDADLGGESDVLSDFDPHGDWGLTEGSASIVESVSGNGLMFTPSYDNAEGYNSCVMRAYMQCIADQKDGWSSAWGLRFYIFNDTYYDAYVSPMAFISNEDGSRTVLSAGLGAYTVDTDNEYYEADLVVYVDNCESTVLIPSGFEGYLVLPFAVMDGDIDEYECGWQILPGWSDAGLTANDVDFANVNDFALDVRMSGFSPDDSEGIIFDSFEFIGNKGDEVEPPEGEEDDETPAPSEPAVGNTDAPADPTDTTSEPADPAPAGNGWIIWVAVGAAAIVVAVVVVIVISKKKKVE